MLKGEVTGGKKNVLPLELKRKVTFESLTYPLEGEARRRELVLYSE